VRYGVSVPNFGVGVDARAITELAREAEEAGWDGFFLWDHLLAFSPGSVPVVDPWVALTAVALSTSRLRLGPMVTPLPRRRPVKLARETVSLDHLSGGRLILGVGIGAMPYEWNYLGEEPDARVRGAMLDKGLEVLAGLWSGEPFDHHGEYYRVAGDPPEQDWRAIFYPPPLQRPRVPIWVAGTWAVKAPFRRAARWDGAVPNEGRGRTHSAHDAGGRAGGGALRRGQPRGGRIFRVGGSRGDARLGPEGRRASWRPTRRLASLGG